MINLNDAYEIADFIKNSKKKTPVKVYINCNNINPKSCDEFKVFGSNNSYTLIGDYNEISNFLNENKSFITDSFIEFDRKNSAIPMYNYLHEHARI